MEILFDNHDGIFPVDDDEVALRRTIDVDKDEFILNRKHVTNSEVLHLLESAGIARSNPYYIVEQRTVNRFAVMSEWERFRLLKGVAGKKVYEDQRIQSLEILQGTQVQRGEIQKLISYIEESLTKMDWDEEDLKEYQQLFGERCALQYTFYEKELQNARDEIKVLDKERKKRTRCLRNCMRSSRTFDMTSVG